MGMTENPYYSPEASGLRTIGQVDWSDGDYQFAYTVVWQRIADGVFLYGEDSGCSCPSPFENLTDVSELTEATPDQIKTHLDKRNADNYAGPRDSEIVQLMEQIQAARR